jgi:hypothetical protein
MKQNSTPFLDLLFNLLLGFAFLFFISFLMIRPVAKKAEAKNNAEYVISVTWPDNNLDDIDTWVEDPAGGLVWFRDKEQNLTHLDRDDLGMMYDVITLSDGTIITNIRNQEITTIRGFMPGEWIVNVHVYSKRDQNPTTVTVSIDKVNPVFKTLYVKNIVLTDAWQEETVTRFEMLANGDILSWADLPKGLVKVEDVYGHTSTRGRD